MPVYKLMSFNDAQAPGSLTERLAAASATVCGLPEIYTIEASLEPSSWRSLTVLPIEVADSDRFVADFASHAEADKPDSQMIVVARLEAEARKEAAPTLCLAVLSNPPDAIEEVFSQVYRNKDMMQVLKLQGAVSGRRYALTPAFGDCPWEMLTVYEFADWAGEELLAEIGDLAGVAEGGGITAAPVALLLEPAAKTPGSGPA